MTNSAQHEIGIALEETYGDERGGVTIHMLPITGTTLALSKGVLETQVITPNRQLTDVRHGKRQVGGNITAELNFDPTGGLGLLLEAGLCGTWEPRQSFIGPLSMDTADNSLNATNGSLSGFRVGEHIIVSGFTNVNNDGEFAVVSATGTKLVLSPVSGGDVVTEAAGNNSLRGIRSIESVLRPSTTRRSFSVYRHFTDMEEGGVQKFHGCEVNKFDMTLAPEAIAAVDFGFVGQRLVVADTINPARDRSGTAINTPLTQDYSGTTGRPFDTFSGSLLLDGQPAPVSEIKLSLENGLVPRHVLFTPDAQEPMIGKTRITGTLTVYLEDASLITAYNGSQRKSLSFTLENAFGDAYTFVLPHLVATGAQADVKGQADVMVPFNFTAIFDAESSISADARHALTIIRTPRTS
jgi:Phage tail tube protein